MPRRISPGTKLRLFADDSLLYRTINSVNDTKILQDDLNNLQNWEQEWRMEFHPQKCQVLRISNKRHNIISDYFIHNEKLEETPQGKYLGINIDQKLSWNCHINKNL